MQHIGISEHLINAAVSHTGTGNLALIQNVFSEIEQHLYAANAKRHRHAYSPGGTGRKGISSCVQRMA